MGQQQGKDQLPVDIGPEITTLSNTTIWTVHKGTSRPSNDPVLVFLFNFANKSDDEIRQARAAHLRLKTLRHPNILRYIDGVELPDRIYMMTEEATPLKLNMELTTPPSDHLISWGFHQIIKTLSFLNNDCNLVHNNISIYSVYVDTAGEWKLSGVEWMYSYNDTTATVPVKSFDILKRYDPPENIKGKRKTQKWSCDMWGLGCLMWEVFNGPMTQSSNLKDTSKFPKSLVSHYCELINANPMVRPNPSELIDSLRDRGGYLSSPFVSLSLKIEELQLMEPDRKNQFFIELNKSLHLFPDSFAHHKVLPHLLNAFEFGGAGPSVLAPLLKIGKLLDEDEYQRKIVPCIVRSFGSNDRATRLNLLQQLDQFIEQLQSSVLNSSLFPQIVTGFSDTVPTIREQTIKASLLLAPKLNDSNLNQLLKFFAKCQLDEQPGIRTNTTICLGKIAPHLNAKTRDKVLVSAFTRSLKDPFPPARGAGIGALGSTHSYYTPQDIATRILPILCHMTIDNEQSIRDQTFKVLRLFVDKLESHSEKMGSSSSAGQEDQSNESTSSSVASWTGWAVSSISKYVATKSSTTPDTTSTNPSTTTTTSQEQTGQHRATKETDVHVQDKTTPPVIDDNWGDDQWEDFNDDTNNSAPGHTHTSGWDDISWEDTFEPTKKTTPIQATPSQSSAPMKLRTESKSPPQDDDFWSRLGTNNNKTNLKRDKVTPPPVPASLFGGGGSKEGNGGGSKGGNEGGSKEGNGGGSKGGSGGWGDWGDDDDDIQFESFESSTTKNKDQPIEPVATTSEGDGWDFDGGGWEEATPTSVPRKQQQEDDAISRQKALEKKREERRARQEEARRKRAQGGANKPSGLGAVKKD